MKDRPTEYNYMVEGKKRNFVALLYESTFASAERGARQILKHNEVLDSVSIKDRKGNVLKVVKQDG